MNHRLMTLVLPLAAALSPLAVQAADGEQWEYTGRVEAQGMNMTMPPTKTCVKPGVGPMPPMDKGCTVNSQLGPAGGRFSFKCTGADPMEGEGEMKLSGDTMSVTMKARGRDGTVSITQSGRKTGRCSNAS